MQQDGEQQAEEVEGPVDVGVGVGPVAEVRVAVAVPGDAVCLHAAGVVHPGGEEAATVVGPLGWNQDEEKTRLEDEREKTKNTIILSFLIQIDKLFSLMEGELFLP